MKTIAILFAATALLAGTGQASTGKAYPAGDANRDGVVTLDEYVAYAKADFARVDANHDGKLTLAEGRAAAKAGKTARAAQRAGQPVFR